MAKLRTVRGLPRRVAAAAGSAVAAPRVLLAVKAALAAALAYLLAPLMPGVTDEYPYYAPLGALISMYPTLMGSARAGLQTLSGLAIGIFLAWLVTMLGVPPLPGVALVVLAGVLVAGHRWLGAGRDYVPMAAMFVLVIGGPDADAFSLGYITQMGLGVAVGLAVNLLVFPPLRLGAAAVELADLRKTLSRQLDDIGQALTEDWPPAHEDWASRTAPLEEAAASVRLAVVDADRSSRGNPRTRFHRHDLPADYADLRTLESITFQVRDLGEELTAAVWGTPFPVSLPPALRPPLSRAMHRVARLLAAWEPGKDPAADLADADAALRDLLEAMDRELLQGAAALVPAASVAMSLQRIVDGIRLRTGWDPADTP
ncbi:FUSC family protein [Arthrobacter halodurans]|uniref:Aromatic acid exporter family protein n=1 Tax=Arthrobacter halodurans TaxID=516699 RepID=A0ABV4ULN5_9MICC